jgi:hypothetical protein
VALTLDWQADGPSRATIRQGGVLVARLFGIPFLAAGGYFAYHFLGGLLHPGELTWAGWTLLPLMMAAFLVPGWILVVGRKRTLLDSARREVVEEMDYLVYTRRKASRVTSDSQVMLRYEQGSKSDTGTRYDIHVYVETGAQLALIALFSDKQKTEALAFAAKAAAFLTIPVRDRLVENGEVTSGGVVVEQLDPEDAD